MPRQQRPAEARLYFVGTIAAALGKSEDTILKYRAKLRVGRLREGRWTFSEEEYEQIKTLAAEAKRGWKKGVKRGTRKWSKARRLADQLRKAKLDAAKKS